MAMDVAELSCLQTEAAVDVISNHDVLVAVPFPFQFLSGHKSRLVKMPVLVPLAVYGSVSHKSPQATTGMLPQGFARPW